MTTGHPHGHAGTTHHDSDIHPHTEYIDHARNGQPPNHPLDHNQEEALYQWAHQQGEYITALFDSVRHTAHALQAHDDHAFNELVQQLDHIGTTAETVANALEQQIDLFNNARFLTVHDGLLRLLGPLKFHASTTFAALEETWHAHDREPHGVQLWVDEFITEYGGVMTLAFGWH
jgi:hypothetical protein